MSHFGRASSRLQGKQTGIHKIVRLSEKCVDTKHGIDALITIICFRKFELFVEFAMSLKNWLSIADTGGSRRYQ